LGPDTLSRYWVMPFEQQYQTMTIKGAYPDARYFSFVAYDTSDDKRPVKAEGALHDAQIAPDPGSVNPFVQPATGVNGTYTVVISHTGQTSGNRIKVSLDFAWVLLRVYVPVSSSRDYLAAAYSTNATELGALVVALIEASRAVRALAVEPFTPDELTEALRAIWQGLAARAQELGEPLPYVRIPEPDGPAIGRALAYAADR
jgi:hypothetical protein